MKNIVVTGVSTGIGYGLVQELMGRGYRVFGSVRTEADAGRLQAEWGEHFQPLLFDVTDRERVFAAAEEVRAALGGEPLAGLINNAGITAVGPLQLQPPEEVRAQFETNVLGLIWTTQAFLPLLGATTPQAQSPQIQPPGRIVNISSTEGRVSTPFLAAYSGSKHAVEGISDSLRRELMPLGIEVLVINAGPVNSENWTKASTGKVARYAETEYAQPLSKYVQVASKAQAGGSSQQHFARQVVDAFETPRPHTRYAFVANKLAFWTLPSLLPDRLLDRMYAGVFGLTRQTQR